MEYYTWLEKEIDRISKTRYVQRTPVSDSVKEFCRDLFNEQKAERLKALKARLEEMK